VTERPLLILGAGTFAVEALEAAELSSRTICGFLVSSADYRTALTLERLPVYVPDDLPFTPVDVVCVAGIVSAHTRVGRHVILNRGANVAHDVELGAFATVGPNAVIAGAVTVGARAWIGVGAVVRDHLAIGEGAVVGAGALVVKPVAAHTLVAGSPAAVVREGVDGL